MLCHRVAFYRHGRTSQVLLHIHTYRPTRRPGSPSRPVSTSGFLQLAQVQGARCCTRHTTQDITSHHRPALQCAHAPQIALPDVSAFSTSRMLRTAK